MLELRDFYKLNRSFIEIMEKRFRRAEYIIGTLINKIRNLPCIRDNNLAHSLFCRDEQYSINHESRKFSRHSGIANENEIGEI